MKKTVTMFYMRLMCATVLLAMKGGVAAWGQTAPSWVQNLEQVFPARDWVAVSASGTSQRLAEQAAMNALARAFKTDVASLTRTSQHLSRIVNEAAGKKSVSLEQSQSLSQEVNTSTSVRGLIGVQADHYLASDGTVYANARMNRRESATRYAGMINENTAVIHRLLDFTVGLPAGFEAYSALSFAAAIAEVTDNFQNILEVLDPAAANRRPSYGGAEAIKTKMREVASAITIGLVVDTEERTDAALISRALGSFFTGRGFKTDERGQGLYLLRANARFESLPFSARIQSSRYYFEAVLENQNGNVDFSFTEDDRKNHNLPQEAKRLALRAVETSVKEGKFAQDFESWLGSLIE
ncbi:MAG: hypothetical protein LBB83_02070 [Treponema sp.]|jgi:hypothetical protein|nr:hypothetical protein [Treponema sp.]